ncbi:GNAT family N-acetyltransferase [Uliginosibacterium sp. H3]|uniref:GNAT family N-acetyltransferase n=1 Tax=Uliginosibacterium silvisoli TaxID=3114758 RepID=A0ABU6K8J5_9RHOO|nr:GNAT family N-acetyltransferase [Uliginosibacterium sp. H3]
MTHPGKFSVARFDATRDSEGWDALCRTAPMATFLHTRAFLSYHGDRFADESRVVRDERNQIIAVFPAARAGQSDVVTSHPGATYGGLVHAGNLLGTDALQALASIARDYRQAGFSCLRYKLTPHIYHRWPAEDDQYALWRLGATCYRCDLSSTIDVATRREPSSRRRRALRSAQSAGITVIDGTANLEAFWPVLVGNLADRHEAKPVHSLEEMQLLMARFPEEIGLLSARIDGKTEAGILLFNAPNVCHAQYIACSTVGREHNALDALFEAAIQQTRTLDRRYFDFGISNENEGRHLNTGLYTFKSEFGGGGSVHRFYELALDDAFQARCDAILSA